MLSDADAKRYGQALANALRHLPIKAAQKTIDYTTFAFVAFSIEMPRIGLSIQKAREPQSAARPTAQVFQFHPPQPPSPGQGATPQGSPSTPFPEGLNLGGLGASAVDTPTGEP